MLGEVEWFTTVWENHYLLWGFFFLFLSDASIASAASSRQHIFRLLLGPQTLHTKAQMHSLGCRLTQQTLSFNGLLSCPLNDSCEKHISAGEEKPFAPEMKTWTLYSVYAKHALQWTKRWYSEQHLALVGKKLRRTECFNLKISDIWVRKHDRQKMMENRSILKC